MLADMSAVACEYASEHAREFPVASEFVASGLTVSSH